MIKWHHQQNTITGESGETSLPGETVFAGGPPDGNISVQFIPEEIKSIRLRNPVERHREMAGGRQSDVNFSKQWISQPFYTRFRGIRTVRLIIRPFLYDSTGRILKVQRDIAGYLFLRHTGIRRGSVSSLTQKTAKSKIKKLIIHPPGKQDRFLGPKIAASVFLSKNDFFQCFFAFLTKTVC